MTAIRFDNASKSTKKASAGAAQPFVNESTLRSDVSRQPPRQRKAPVRSGIGRSVGKWLTICGVLFAVAVSALSLLPNLFSRFNPFAVTKVDRSGPVLLTAITDMHTYQAASGQFQVVVDIEKDAKWMPSALRGERVLVIAQGSVDAGVDFSKLSAQSITIDPVTKAVSITLPHATLGKAHIDLQESKVVQHDRGLFDRVGSAFGDAPTADREAFKAAEKKLATKAARSDLVARAEQNTAAMLKQLAAGLGHANVLVRFDDKAVWVAPIVFSGTSSASPK
jgi:Protein of unknown function (DUF4230)